MDVTDKPACVNESQTEPSSWKKWRLASLVYRSVGIQVLVFGLLIATSSYMKRHKIPISTILAESTVYDYLIFSQYNIVAVWAAAVLYGTTHGDDIFPYRIIVANNIFGCLSSIYGLAYLAFLFYSIFPGLALYVSLFFVLCSIVAFIHSMYLCYLVEVMSKKPHLL